MIFCCSLASSVRIEQWKWDKLATRNSSFSTTTTKTFYSSIWRLSFVIWDHLVQTEHPHLFCTFYTHISWFKCIEMTIVASRQQSTRVQQQALLYTVYTARNRLNTDWTSKYRRGRQQSNGKNKTSLVFITSSLCCTDRFSCLIGVLVFTHRLWFFPTSPSASSQRCPPHPTFLSSIPSPCLVPVLRSLRLSQRLHEVMAFWMAGP